MPGAVQMSRSEASLPVHLSGDTFLNVFTEHVHPNKRDVSRERTRAAVLDAATRLFRERGYEATSVRAIAASARVSVGAVMGVGTKDELLVSIFVDEIERLSVERFGPAGPDQGLPPARVVEEILAGYFDLISGQAELARAWGAALLTDGRHADTLRNLHDALVGEVGGVLQGSAPREVVEGATEDLYISYLGFLFAWASGVYPAVDAVAALRVKVQHVLREIGVK